MNDAAETAASIAYPGSRAATGEEYASGLIVGLPTTNDSGHDMVLCSPGNENQGSLQTGRKLEYWCVKNGAPLGEGMWSNSMHMAMQSSLACVVDV